MSDTSKRRGTWGAGGSTTVEVPKVVLPESVWSELRQIVELAGGEITVFGTVDAGHGELVVSKLFIPNQSCTAAGTVVDETDLAELLRELVDAEVDVARLRLYAHSHGEMDVFWSQTDVATVQSGFPQSDWILALVTNRRGDTRACLRLDRPIDAVFDDLPVEVRVDRALRDRLAAEITKRVRTGAPNGNVGAVGAGV